MKKSGKQTGIIPVVVVIIAILAAFSSVNAATTDSQTETESGMLFSDIGVGDKHYVALKYLKEHGLIQGYEDGSFKPLNEINRAEALKILIGALKNPESKMEKDENEFFFHDVTPVDWYFSYVQDAWAMDLVQGYPDGLFHPEKTINMAESLKITILLEGEPLSEEIFEQPYNDVPLNAWYAPYAEVAKYRTLVLESRPDGNLFPGENMNRGEFAELIYRIIMTQKGKLYARTTWYGFEGVNWGTASGEEFDTNAMTMAHQTLPFGTQVLVTNLANGKSVVVKVNDRGPSAQGIDVDLTSGAFEEIASLGAGVINTEFEVIAAPNETPPEVTNSNLNDISEYGF